MTKRKKTVRERYHTLVGANRWWQGDGLPTEMLRAVSDMKQQLIMMNEYGPYVLEVPIALRGRFQQNYSTFGTNTIHERLSATDGFRIEYVAGIKVPRLVPVCEDVVTGSDPDHPRCKCDPSPIGSRHELEVELIKKTEYVKVLEGRLARLDELSDIQPESNVIDDLRKIITNLQEKYIAAAREKYNLSEQSRLDGQKIAALRQHVSRLQSELKWQTDRTIEKNDELHKLKGTIQSEVDKALAKERREVIDGIIGGYWTEPKLNHVVQWLQGRMSPKKVERLQCPNCHTDFFQFKMEKQP